MENTVNVEKGKPNRKRVIVIAVVLALIALGIAGWLVVRWQSQIVAISVAYNGNTTAGTALDNENDGVLVTATKRNGETISLSPGEWDINSPKTLQPDESATVIVRSNNQTGYLTVQCTDSLTQKISVEYSGSTDEGTVIDRDTDGLKVTATMKDGSTRDVTGECTVKDAPIPLEANKIAKIEVVYTDPLNGAEYSDSITVRCSSRSLRQIAVKYTGSALEGEVLDSSNPDIHVLATFTNGDVEEVSGWTVEEAAVLEASRVSFVTVCYGELSAELRIECQTQLDEKTYKDGCKNVSYKDLARTPENYLNQFVKITGVINRITEPSTDTDPTVYEIKYYRDQYIRIIFEGEFGDSKFIKKDSITCYGIFEGIDTESYNEMPLIRAKYITRSY